MQIEALPGDHISKVAQRAVDAVAAGAPRVVFDFNDIMLTVEPGQTAADVCAEYNRKCDERHAAYVASDEYKQRQREAEEKEQKRQTALSDALANAPEHMTLRDADAWVKWREANKDGYGGAVMTYAERWARVMEGRIANGETLEACADSASHLADSEGITGFMYGAAVATLASCWIHGEALRRWHNRTIQIGDEGERANETGGVLNPAMLGVGHA